MAEPLVIRLAGELGLEAAGPLRDTLLNAIRDSDAAVLILDMSAVSFADSTGVSALLAAHKRLNSEGRELRLAALQDPVLRTLQVMGLHKILRVHATLAAAQA